MSRPSPEVLVVGAGPAGLAVGLALAPLGITVRVIDRQPTPVDKIGETLPPGSEALFRALGVDADVAAAGFARVRGIRVRLDGRESFSPFSADPQVRGYQLERGRFEARLAAALEARGGVVSRGSTLRAVEGTADAGIERVLVEDEGGLTWLRPRILVDASGPARVLSRRLGLPVGRGPRTVAITRYIALTGASEETLYETLEGGWLWSVARADGLRNVTVGVDRAAVRGGVGPAFLGLVASSELLSSQERAAALGSAAPLRATDATLQRAVRNAGPGWMLAGDAASTIDPLTAHGVVKALTGGLRAAGVVRCLLEDPGQQVLAERFLAHAARLERGRYAASTRALFEEAGHVEARFWAERRLALAAEPAPPNIPGARAAFLEAIRSTGGQGVRLAPGAILDRDVAPTLEGGRLGTRAVLTVEGWPLELPSSVDVDALARAVASPGRAAEVFERYRLNSGAAPDQTLAKSLTLALSTLVEHGALAWEPRDT